jgi:SAM-dependent methyltransferase
MIPELSRDPFNETEQTVNVINTTLYYLSRKGICLSYTRMLDVGRESPLTIAVKILFGIEVYNTKGDLDEGFYLPRCGYFDYILYSHTIEHQFNPLHTLLELKKVMNSETKMFIILPNKPKFLWWEGHFHEIDPYRMGLLLKRAGLRIVSYERHRVWRGWRFYLTGIRPLLRLFCEYNDYYEVKL